MKSIIIGLSGLSKVRNELVADIIIEDCKMFKKLRMEYSVYNVVQKKLKLTEAQVYGNEFDVVDKRYNCTPRYIFKTLGTQWTREIIGNGLHIQKVEHEINRQGGLFIIPDIKFESEADMVHKYGIMIHIEDYDTLNFRCKIREGLTAKPGDLIINDYKSLKGLTYQVKKVLNVIKQLNV